MTIVTAIEEKAERLGASALTAAERVLFVAWVGSTIIRNGGFYRFYGEGGDIGALESAYRALGLEDCADACVRSTTLFPDGVVSGPRAEREAFLRSRWPAIDTEFDAMSDPIMDLGLRAERLVEATKKFLASRTTLGN
jgi:hypothetical protein